LVTYW